MEQSTMPHVNMACDGQQPDAYDTSARRHMWKHLAKAFKAQRVHEAGGGMA
jgi:hypothetical protein